MITRRHFLSLSAMAALSNAIAGPKLPLPLPNRTLKVLVIGAGPAGLSAAYELEKVGHQVNVYEARARTGGRMHTLRKPFDHGLYAEAGALFLSSDNPGIKYCEEFGLKLKPIRCRLVFLKEQTIGFLIGFNAARFPHTQKIIRNFCS